MKWSAEGRSRSLPDDNNIKYLVFISLFVATLLSYIETCHFIFFLLVPRMTRLEAGDGPNGAGHSGVAQNYKVLDQPHGAPSNFKIIGIGAGASGLYLAYSCMKRMQNYNLTIYEKNRDVGGTWLESN